MTNYKNIEKMIDEVLIKEGGFVDHKNDRGGPTNYGITQPTLSVWYGRVVSVLEVKNLDIEIARKIYRQNYYYKPSINELPFEIQPIIFDSAINHGPQRAIKFLQKVLNKAGFGHVKIDGAMGPKTMEAAFKAHIGMGTYLNNSIVCERINFYKKIVLNDQTQSVFFKGWLARAESFREEI